MGFQLFLCLWMGLGHYVFSLSVLLSVCTFVGIGGGSNQKVDGPIPPFPSSSRPSPLNPARDLGESCKLPQLVRAEPSQQTSFGESKLPFAAFWARLVRISCSSLKTFTSHNGSI